MNVAAQLLLMNVVNVAVMALMKVHVTVLVMLKTVQVIAAALQL